MLTVKLDRTSESIQLNLCHQMNDYWVDECRPALILTGFPYSHFPPGFSTTRPQALLPQGPQTWNRLVWNRLVVMRVRIPPPAPN